jgi:peptidoglycan/LPS O-acetylase OafA/YrhL
MTVNAFLEKDNNNFDLIRLILACMVIAGHAEVINVVHDNWTEFFYAYLPPTSYGDVAVKIFFFLSGLLITNSFLKNPSIISFLVARVFRLLPALIFVSVLVALVFGPFLSTLTSADYFASGQPWLYVVKNVFLKIQYLLPGVFENQAINSVNGSLWTLPIEFRFYLICLGILLVAGKYKRIVFNILFLVILLDATVLDQHLISAFGDKPAMNLLPVAFGLGMFFALNADRIKVDHRITLGLFLLFFMLKQALYFETVFILFYCVLAFFIATRKSLFKFKPRLDLSYGIYLWGYFVQQCIFHFLGSIHIYLHIFLAIGISVILAYFTHVMIEKPFIKLGKKASIFLKDKFQTIIV